MALSDSETDPVALAAYHEGLAHPARVAALRALRQERRMPLSDLRKAVSATVGDVDTRTMQFHAYKMQLAGIITVSREDGREVASLLRDLSLRVKPVPGV